MPNLKITPPSVLVTAGQAVTFQATDDANHPVGVTWSLTPQLGSLVTAAPLPPGQAAPSQGHVSSSATYVAPSLVQTAQTVAVTAASHSGTASATLSITPDAISIMPTTVDLRARQKQQFVAVVASLLGDAEPITWILAPQVEALDDAGLYTAPDVIPDDGTLTITAASKHLGKQVSATVALKPEPWRGFGTVLLGGYLFLVFCAVYLLIGLWPSEIPSIDALKVDRAEAQSNLDNATLALRTALGPGTNSITMDAARQLASDTLLKQLTADLGKAQQDLNEATEKLKSATSPYVDTSMVRHINREIDLLYLVLLAGSGQFSPFGAVVLGFLGQPYAEEQLDLGGTSSCPSWERPWR